MILSMVGCLSECVLLAYRTPAASVQPLVPSGLELLTRGEWAFWSIVACRIEHMRPRGLPRLCGVNYCHVAYRLYVRARAAGGEVFDGIYFVRSDADHGLLAACGNVLTDFRFHRADIRLAVIENTCSLEVSNSRDGLGEARLAATPEAAPALAPGPASHRSRRRSAF